MIGPDIVELIKLWARIPNNEAFVALLLPQVQGVMQNYYQHLCTSPNELEA